MDPTSQFFSKLRKLAVNLESETARLQHAFENRNTDDDSGDAPENKARGMRAYHELNSEVGNLKVQIQGELAEQKAQENEVSSFVKACKVMEQKVCRDIQTLKTHLEKYGYHAPIQKPIKPKDQEVEAEDKAAEQDETNAAVADEGSQEEDEESQCSSPQKMEPPFADAMRTPQLSDFGLSELQLKRALAGPEWCSELPPMPEMNLPHPSLNTPAPPPMPITPKCTLRMDDDELQTPQMHHFGISEHTMCLNNDFTMALFQKNVKNTQRPPQDIPVPAMNSVVESLQTKVDSLPSPELPVLFTPGLKIKKTNGQCSPPAQSNGHPDSPCRPDILPTTPEVPAFQTPYVNRLVSTKKSARQPEPIDTQADHDSRTLELQMSPCNKAAGSKRSWEYNIPVSSEEVKQVPEMPNLESALGNSLQSRNGKILKMNETDKVGKNLTVNSLQLDGPTQEFSLGTPRIRTNFQEPSTPEMPDLSSVTQDICKLVSQAQSKKTADIHPLIQPEEDKRSSLPQAESLSVVSQSEFQTLPNYLRRMNLSSLNQAVHSINRYTEAHRGEMKDLSTEVLKKIINVGTMAPIYILCLNELKRLKQVDGVLGTAAYKLITHN